MYRNLYTHTPFKMCKRKDSATHFPPRVSTTNRHLKTTYWQMRPNIDSEIKTKGPAAAGGGPVSISSANTNVWRTNYVTTLVCTAVYSVPLPGREVKLRAKNITMWRRMSRCVIDDLDTWFGTCGIFFSWSWYHLF